MSTPYPIDLHPDVESDYGQAYHWYEMKQKGLGERFLLAVREELELIKLSPELHGFKSRKDFREAIVKDFPYLVVYKVYSKQKRIFISAIHHTSLNPNKKYRKQDL